jgi:hypothetical protein
VELGVLSLQLVADEPVEDGERGAPRGRSRERRTAGPLTLGERDAGGVPGQASRSAKARIDGPRDRVVRYPGRYCSRPLPPESAPRDRSVKVLDPSRTGELLGAEVAQRPDLIRPGGDLRLHLDRVAE